MAKSQMQFAYRAWRTVTKSFHWDKDQPKHKRERFRAGDQSPFKSKKEWKAFCRSQADTTVYSRQLHGDNPFTNQDDADSHVLEELSYWD